MLTAATVSAATAMYLGASLSHLSISQASTITQNYHQRNSRRSKEEKEKDRMLKG